MAALALLLHAMPCPLPRSFLSIPSLLLPLVLVACLGPALPAAGALRLQRQVVETLHAPPPPAISYPLCPLTGLLPRKQDDPKTRCVDAANYTCCDKCTDMRQALGLVSANFSNFIQWIGLTPYQLGSLNAHIGPIDSDMCSLYAKVPILAGSTTWNCEAHLEQLACAMSCHPNAGDFVKQNADGSFNLTVCRNYYFNIVNDCGDTYLPGDSQSSKVVSFIGYGPQTLNDIGNVAYGLAGAPEFHVKFSTHTDPPGCWPGPPADGLPTPFCCDPLSTAKCPKGAIDFTANPNWKSFADKNNANVTALCRAQYDWNNGGLTFVTWETHSNITNFSPPPAGQMSYPIVHSKVPPPPPAPPFVFLPSTVNSDGQGAVSAGAVSAGAVSAGKRSLSGAPELVLAAFATLFLFL